MVSNHIQNQELPLKTIRDTGRNKLFRPPCKSGAQEVQGVYGFGSNQNWEGVSSIQLKKEGEGTFKGVLPLEHGKNINIAFKDSAENWDNNSGMNYTFVN